MKMLIIHLNKKYTEMYNLKWSHSVFTGGGKTSLNFNRNVVL
jgi:hypothetical protein